MEHLLMPWKFVVELNRVLETGGFAYFLTHQCWPLHDEPWDFWRFSSDAWSALFNPATGFKILNANMGEPAFVVANRCHTVTNFGETPAGFLASSVLVQKISNTTLDWSVDISDVLTSAYPATTSQVKL